MLVDGTWNVALICKLDTILFMSFLIVERLLVVRVLFDVTVKVCNLNSRYIGELSQTKYNGNLLLCKWYNIER